MTPSLFDIWCKLCAMFNAIIMLCQGLTTLATNMSTISMNNVNIKAKVEDLVGDPDAPCPDCGPPGEGLVAEQAVTQNLVSQTAAMQAATADIKAQAVSIRTKLGVVAGGGKEAATEKEAVPATPAPITR